MIIIVAPRADALAQVGEFAAEKGDRLFQLRPAAGSNEQVNKIAASTATTTIRAVLPAVRLSAPPRGAASPVKYSFTESANNSTASWASSLLFSCAPTSIRIACDDKSWL